jgi:hypothetical protein
MTADTSKPGPDLDLQLLVAADGTLYAIPRAVLEAGRLSDEDAATVRAELTGGSDVQGFTANDPFLQALASYNAAKSQFKLALTTLQQHQQQQTAVMQKLFS